MTSKFMDSFSIFLLLCGLVISLVVGFIGDIAAAVTGFIISIVLMIIFQYLAAVLRHLEKISSTLESKLADNKSEEQHTQS